MSVELERRLDERMEEQRIRGGDIMTYGQPDPLDVAARAQLRRYREGLEKIRDMAVEQNERSGRIDLMPGLYTPFLDIVRNALKDQR